MALAIKLSIPAVVLLQCLGSQSAPAQASATNQRFELSAFDYRCVGPTRGGRVTTVTGVRQRSGLFFMGTTGGGVWRTRNYGSSWHNVTDGQIDSPSIGAIRVAPSDPDIVWMGTGSDGLRSNVIVGCGVYKSIDGGESWSHQGLPQAGLIGAVEIHPHNPDVVFVAAIGNPFGPNPQRGLYRTIDGGASWQHVLSISNKTGVVDVEFCPADPTRLYACAWTADRKPWTITSGSREGGVFLSEDAGTSWRKLGGGLPEGVVGKSDLAVTAADPTRVYVLIEAAGKRGGVYRSVDGGVSFQQVSDNKNVRARPFYYTNIDVSPVDADDVFVSATRFLRSRNGGKTWKRLATTHGDHHDLWIHPDNADLWIQGNDGGASITLDAGATWSRLENQPTAELYQVAVDSRFPYWIYAGQQDNSTIRVPSFPPRRAPGGHRSFWESVGGCETGPAIPHPTDPDIVFANCKGRFGVFNARTGQEQRYDVGAANMYGHNPRDLAFRFQRVAPIHVSPHDPECVYHASQFVHKTTDRGRSWERISDDLTANPAERQVISGAPITRDITGEEFYSCIYALRESKLARGVIWVGSNDGVVWVTKNGGAEWSRVTPPELPPGGRVQTVEPSPHDPAKAYIAVLRYQLDDPRPWVFRTSNYGATWIRITTGRNGVPADCPTRVVREDPERAGLLYCGTERGMYVSLDDGGRWERFQLDLPLTPVTDLVVHDDDLVLSTMGRSFWVLDDLTPLRTWRATARADETHLFRPRRAHRLRYRPRKTAPEYSPIGATIDYWLAKDVDPAGIALDVLDPNGKIVRRFRGLEPDAEQITASTDRMEQTVTRPDPEPRLGFRRGHHRLRWDLRYTGTGDHGKELVNRQGPLAAPGEYRIRLRVGADEDDGVTLEQRLELSLDPRVIAAGVSEADVEAQLALQLRVRTALIEAARLAQRVADDPEMSTVHAGLVTAKGAYPQPMLIDQLKYLANLLDVGDQRPGRDAEQRCSELERELQRLSDMVRD